MRQADFHMFPCPARWATKGVSRTISRPDVGVGADGEAHESLGQGPFRPGEGGHRGDLRALHRRNAEAALPAPDQADPAQLPSRPFRPVARKQVQIRAALPLGMARQRGPGVQLGLHPPGSRRGASARDPFRCHVASAYWAMVAHAWCGDPGRGAAADRNDAAAAAADMTARRSKAGPGVRFDVTALRKLAGEKVFERGEDYHADGQVEILSLEPERVLAQVAGSDDYRTVLTGRGKKIGGECSCPAFTDWGFCKHMVATALAANEALDDVAAGNGAAADAAGALGRIRTHLKAKGADALVDIIVELAERDPVLFRKLDMAAATVQGDDKSLETRLLRAIDGATRTGSFVDYREATAWADQVAAAVGAVADLAAGERARLALRLGEHAIARIERAVEHIDGSPSTCSALLEQAP